MTSSFCFVVVPVVCYLLGAFSPAIFLSRILGLQDPRHAGSGNPGATNILRLSGKKMAAGVLFFDILKGFLAVILARACVYSDAFIVVCAVAAFFGHIFPVYFRFHGGKGVATALGCLLGFSWGLGLFTMTVWFFVALLFRYSALAALVSSALTPLYALFYLSEPFFMGVLMMSLTIIVRHRSNIKRLIRGTEGKLGQKG